MITRDDLDLSAQVARVKAKTRPWKSIIALVLAVAAAVTSEWARAKLRHGFFSPDDVPSQIIAAGTAVAFCVFASAATIGLSGKARSVLEPRTGPSHAAVVRYALVLIGAVTTLLVTLALFDIPVTQLLLGGALTSVFVGIAAQQSLSNVFAGLVLMLAHPFRVGDAIRLRAGALSGEIDGTVTEIGITYTRLSTNDGIVSVPNSQVLNAVVGPLTPSSPPALRPTQRLPQPSQYAAPEPPQSAATQAAPPSGSQAPQPPASQATEQPSPPGSDSLSRDGSAAGPVGTADGAGGIPNPTRAGEQ